MKKRRRHKVILYVFFQRKRKILFVRYWEVPEKEKKEMKSI